jgi:hypothetical protein
MIICVRCIGQTWMKPLEENVGEAQSLIACKVLSLLSLFGWWMDCANIWFYNHSTLQRAWPKDQASVPLMESFSQHIYLRWSQTFMVFELC